jgi:cellulose synthase/poly-beta-1,6-N-acetylglucosamine synthase-like glycosyltransferase/peptidoglycan/xylan/chitin deacetylase (PgdA/CDA1 family)/spore germination protein YaaH
MDPKPVFYDPGGRRRTWAARVGAFVATLVAVLTTLTLLAALFTTLLPVAQLRNKSTALPGIPIANERPADFLTRTKRLELASEIVSEERRTKTPSVRPKGVIAAGFYAPWQASGLASLRGHASALTHLMPQWLHLKADGMNINGEDFDLQSNPSNRDVVSICRQKGVQIVPILDNQGAGDFDPKRLRALLSNPQARHDVAHELYEFLTDHNFSGINLDFEINDAANNNNFLAFLDELHKQFAPAGLIVTVDIEAESPLPLEQVADKVDFMILMAYDEHSEDGGAGPLADIDWSEGLLQNVLKTVPEEKLVLGMGNYAYDWLEGHDNASNMTFQDALTAASGYRSEPPFKVIQFDRSTLNNMFAYRDDDDKRHVVWMLDAVSAYNQWQAAKDDNVAGAALWYMGAEDPSIWSFFDRGKLRSKLTPKPLESIAFPYEVSFEGKGEILNIVEKPQEGSRSLETDPDTGLISACTYTSYAFPYVVQKSGYIPNKLALTFDDGPDPTWTPPILDALKQLNLPATFFVIGNSCESHPELVAREYNDGHEIGSHSFFHPNMGETSDRRDVLELNLTQFAIEAATGRSTTIFRPPYNADSEPETKEQLRPIEIANQLGYTVIAENIDPTDWDLAIRNPETGAYLRPKNANDIVKDVENQLAEAKKAGNEGNVILLHDGGGDRSATVAALRLLVPQLRAQGYEFVPVSTLMRESRAQIMPPIPSKDWQTYILAKLVLGTTYWILWFLSVAFTVAIGLGLARVVVVTALALVKLRKEPPLYAVGFQPSVSVLIAAFNEAAVIVRTVESVLGSRYPLAEVVVIDDGSTDGTAEVAEAAFSEHPVVRIVRQENGGKSSALNRGIESAKGEILFCIDADTQLDPNAIGLVTRHFEDSSVGAVAGNVKVGNPVNVITFWQSLEYTTSQNLDRRAYALLNAITVVPGAIGGWRKSAILQVGSYLNDTLAEDMDLTWRLRRAGFRLENEPHAYAYTEAPESFRAFFKQRFRWAYGTLQCLYKHRRALFHFGWFGWVILPSLWVFQVGFQSLAPLVDLEVILSVVNYVSALFGSGSENGSLALAGETQTIVRVLFLYGVFFATELISAAIATRLDRQRYSLLWWLFLQRFAYRQIMYGVIYRSLVRAITGGRTGWGKLDRKGTVKIPPSPKT